MSMAPDTSPYRRASNLKGIATGETTTEVELEPSSPHQTTPSHSLEPPQAPLHHTVANPSPTGNVPDQFLTHTKDDQTIHCLKHFLGLHSSSSHHTFDLAPCSSFASHHTQHRLNDILSTLAGVLMTGIGIAHALVIFHCSDNEASPPHSNSISPPLNPLFG